MNTWTGVKLKLSMGRQEIKDTCKIIFSNNVETKWYKALLQKRKILNWEWEYSIEKRICFLKNKLMKKCGSLKHLKYYLLK